jgi:hypothetical protein
MEERFLMGCATVACVFFVVLAFGPTGTQLGRCPRPIAASVATLFAPCQAFDEIAKYRTKQEETQIRLLTPYEQLTPSTAKLASWENPAP